MVKAKKSPQPKTYSQMQVELDEILSWFDRENTDIDEALVLYERAMKLIADMEAYLRSSGNKLKKINSRFKP